MRHKTELPTHTLAGCDTLWSIFLCCDASVELRLLLPFLPPSRTPPSSTKLHWKSMQERPPLDPPRGCVLIDYLSAGRRVGKMGGVGWRGDQGERHSKTQVERERGQASEWGRWRRGGRGSQAETGGRYEWQKEENDWKLKWFGDFVVVARTHFCRFSLNCIFWQLIKHYQSLTELPKFLHIHLAKLHCEVFMVWGKYTCGYVWCKQVCW